MIVRYHTTYKMDICLNKQKKREFHEKYVFQDVVYREYSKRTAFIRMNHELKKGDVVVVESLEMLGNTTTDLLNKMKDLMKKEVCIEIEDIDTTTNDKIELGAFLTVMQNAIVKKNQELEEEEKDIQEFYKTYHSRKMMELNYVKLMEDLYKYLDGELTVRKIAKKYEVSRSFLYGFMKEQGMKKG